MSSKLFSPGSSVTGAPAGGASGGGKFNCGNVGVAIGSSSLFGKCSIGAGAITLVFKSACASASLI